MDHHGTGRARWGTLAAGDPPGHGMTRANGRVRDVPNERLIRWYATVGLVDPPLSRRGRVARYGPRHLLQLVAIKRRQAEGRSLAEIQAELAARPTRRWRPLPACRTCSRPRQVLSPARLAPRGPLPVPRAPRRRLRGPPALWADLRRCVACNQAQPSARP
jgi:hypothetical protein